MSQTRSTNPFRPGSGILPPLLAGREHETAILQGRIERTRQGQPEHTALLGDWAIGKTTLLMHWRRLLRHARRRRRTDDGLLADTGPVPEQSGGSPSRPNWRPNCWTCPRLGSVRRLHELTLGPLAGAVATVAPGLWLTRWTNSRAIVVFGLAATIDLA